MSDDICSKCQKPWSAKSCCMMHVREKAARIQKSKLVSLYDVDEILQSYCDDAAYRELYRMFKERAEENSKVEAAK